MEPYFAGERLWAAGTTSLELYVVPDLDVDRSLGSVLDHAARVLEPLPQVALTPYHATILPITRTPAALIEQSRRRALGTSIEDVTSVTPAFEILAGPPQAGSMGVLMDTYPDTQVNDLVSRLRLAITQVVPDSTAAGYNNPAHLTLGYGRQHADSGLITSALRRGVRPSHAPLTISRLLLVRTRQDVERCQFRWRVVRDFPLAAAPRTAVLRPSSGS